MYETIFVLSFKFLIVHFDLEIKSYFLGCDFAVSQVTLLRGTMESPNNYHPIPISFLCFEYNYSKKSNMEVRSTWFA